MSDDAVCVVCGSSQHGNWECKPEQAPREQKIQWFERAWVMINLPAIAVLSRGLSHGLVTEIERLRERAKQNIDAKYEIGRMLGCPEHEELLPWIVRYRDEHERLREELAGWETMRESYYHLEDLLTKKNKRIEELGKERDFYLDKACNGEPEATGTWIRYDQIDAAWRVANCFSPETNSYAQEPLKELGIERCEGCDGVGHWEQEPQTGGAYPNQKPTCSDCDGHGWVLGMEVGEDGKCQPEPCPNCDGSGKREQYYPPVVEEDCPDCNGMGG